MERINRKDILENFKESTSDNTNVSQNEYTNVVCEAEESTYMESLSSVNMDFEIPPIGDFFSHISKPSDELDLTNEINFFGSSANKYRWKIFDVVVVLDKNFSKSFVNRQLNYLYTYRNSIFEHAERNITEGIKDIYGRTLSKKLLSSYFSIDHVELVDKSYIYLGFGTTNHSGPYKDISFIMGIKNIGPRGYLYIVKESTWKKKK